MAIQKKAITTPSIHIFGLVIVSLAVLFFYSNLPIYLGILDKIVISNPVYWFGLFAVLALAVFIPPLFARGIIPKTFFSNPVFFWSICYLAILSLWYIVAASSPSVDIIFKNRVIGLTLLTVFLFLFFQGSYVQLWARRMILLSIVLAVAFNVWEVFHPSSFVPITFYAATPGRSAGLYINPNQAGAALILGMILTITLIPIRYRLYFIFYVLIGVILTFSRSMSLGWLIAVIVLWQQKIIKLSSFILVTTVFLLAIYSFLPDIVYFIKVNYGIFAEEGIYMRMGWFAHPMFDVDTSETARMYVANISWQMFLDNPLFGNGIGSTDLWAELVSTHNMYLYLMADYGILGIILYPLLVLVTVWHSHKEVRSIALAFASFALMWGFFSHNIMSEYYSLIAFALMASMSYQSRIDEKESD